MPKKRVHRKRTPRFRADGGEELSGWQPPPEAMMGESVMSLRSFSEFWLLSVRPSVSGRTWDRYQLDMSYVLDRLGNLALDQIRPHHITTADQAAQADGLTTHQRHKGAEILRILFRAAVQLGYCEVNPTEGPRLIPGFPAGGHPAP
jgi:hypothetical protein